jgi:hydroxypyruvate reductase
MSSPGCLPGPIRVRSTDAPQPTPKQLTQLHHRLREDLATIIRAAIEGVDAGGLVRQAIRQPDIVAPLQRAAAVDVIAAGKASAVMLNAFASSTETRSRRMLGIGPQLPPLLPQEAEWHTAGHPLPTAGSVTAANRALELARVSGPDDLLVVLLSGGGSALMTLPADGISLADKQRTARTLMERSADIYELNTVRKHLSGIKGGQLAAAAGGSVLTLAVSDVVGDDLSVIASGPTVPDDSTYTQALAILNAHGGLAAYPAAVVQRLQQGSEGFLPETPQTGDARLQRSTARVIGPQRGAIEGAERAAQRLGYHILIAREPVTGEARETAVAHVGRMAVDAAGSPRPLCIISSGETTVTVRGNGRGGRNQEFALAMAGVLGVFGDQVAGASIGTDGIDGPTDAAGAIVDTTTLPRAAAAGLDAGKFLDDNNTYVFFERLGDLIKTGPTATNVGDLQVILAG